MRCWVIGWSGLQHAVVRTALIVLVGVTLAVSVASPAAAGERDFGDMVDYELTFPVDGTSQFGDTFWAWRPHGTHGSQDLMADKGVPVVAAATGTVRLVNWSRDAGLNPSRCCSVVIDHDDGWQTRYLHLTNDRPGTDDGQGWGIASGIVPGARVRAGQLIGWVGDSGNAETTPPHLHFELFDPDGVKVDSYEALRAAERAKAGDVTSLTAGALIRRGDRGEGVAQLQEHLATLGYDVGTIDGIFGSMTEAAVLGLQGDHRLDADGVVGKVTKGAIAGLLRPDGTVIGFGRRGVEVERLQDALNAAGQDAGVADGIFGPKTLTAVLAYQTSEQLTIDGLAGPQTMGKLGLR